MLDDLRQDTEMRMTKSLDALAGELRHLRTGRASTALVDGIKVPYYGSNMPLTQVATVVASDARTLTITPWEKSMVGPVEKALLASDIGVTPTTAGTVIRLNLPALTEDRRHELARHVAHAGENAKIAVRSVRRDAMQRIKDALKDKAITEDDVRQHEDQIQKVTDSFVEQIDTAVKTKTDELLAL